MVMSMVDLRGAATTAGVKMLAAGSHGVTWNSLHLGSPFVRQILR